MRSRFGKIAALALAVAALAGVAACTKSGEEREPFGRLGVDDVAGKLGQPGVFVYDNNAKERFAAGHLPGATWLDYDDVKASDLPADKAATLVFYCANEH
jgi:hypothetical protein